MRELTGHIINTVNDKLKIIVVDEPGNGGASHRYLIEGFNTGTNTSYPEQPDREYITILFQNGPITEVGANGVTQEALLEIVADRLRSFQAGAFSCRENELALTKIEEAQHWLQQRTLTRMRRNVEGKNIV